jgi:hypothetical protein
MSFTSDDIYAANEYANHRSNLILLKKLYDTHPHIASWLDYTVTQADPTTDYYYDKSFSHRAIKVNIKLSEMACNMVSCDSKKISGSCAPSDEVQYEQSGDIAKFRLICQPSCFNVHDTQTYDDDGKVQAQMPNLVFYKGECRFQPTIKSWFDSPEVRSEDRYEQRINDLPRGFDPRNNESGFSNLNYSFNSSYCDAFYDDKEDVIIDGFKCTECQEPLLDKILGAVVGESFIKFCQEGVRDIKNVVDTLSGHGSKSPYSVPAPHDIPDVPEYLKKENWKKNINPSFIVPDPDISLDPNATYNVQSNYDDGHKNTYRSEVLKLINKRIGRGEYSLTTEQRRMISEKLINSRRDFESAVLKLDDEEEMDSNAIHKFFDLVFTGITEAITDVWTYVGILEEELITKIASEVEQFAVKLATELIPKVVESMIEGVGKMFAECASKSIIGVVGKEVSTMAIKLVGDLATFLAECVAEAATVIGTILIVLQVLDLILMFWDPCGFNNKYSAQMLLDLMRNNETSMKNAMSMKPIMDGNYIMIYVLQSDEITTELMKTFKYYYEYLDHLTVNSEGSRINKGKVLDPSKITDEMTASAGSKCHNKTTKNIADDQRFIRQRMLTFKYIQYGTFISAAIGTVLLVMGMSVTALAVYAIMCIFILMMYMNSTTSIGKYIPFIRNEVESGLPIDNTTVTD